MKKIFLIIVLLLFSQRFFTQSRKGELDKINTNDNYNYLAGNEILMWVGNNGMCAHDPRNDASGFYWPGGENAIITAIFTDGLIWGGKIDDEIRVGGATYRYGLQAGKILPNGDADNPEQEKYRIYKIRKGIIDKDYNEWPVEDGAPWIDIDGDEMFSRSIDKPQSLGDETIWYVMNDLDSSRTHLLYGSEPIGLEVQVTMWASMEMPDVLFKKYIIINKSNTTIKDMYFGQWSEPDVGYASDDYFGCDTTLSLAFCYNADNDDEYYYRLNPPALGYSFLQGPIVEGERKDTALIKGRKIPGYKNLPLTSFILYINAAGTMYRDPQLGTPRGGMEMYNNLQGSLWDGSPVINPINGEPTVFCTPGDPVYGTGWYEGAGWPRGPNPDNRRLLASCGPIVMQPADTQEVVIAVHMARGENNIHSVKKLKDQSKILHEIYNNPDWFKFSITPKLESYAGDGDITLWWNSDAEKFELTDYMLMNSELEDTTYSFEGYRVFQFSDEYGSNPIQIDIYDINNGIELLYDFRNIEGKTVRVPVLRAKDEGLRRWIKINKDYYTNSPLLNGKKYYFGVTAFAYSPSSGNQLLESEPVIIEVIPGREPIDYTRDFDPDDLVKGEHIEGDGDGYAIGKIIDESNLTGDKYEVKIFGDIKTASYSITNTTKDLLIVDKSDEFNSDTLMNEIYDGLMFIINNIGRDSINSFGYNELTHKNKASAIKEIVETANGNGILENPHNVYNQQNSTNSWLITNYITDEGIENINSRDNLGYDNYEMRFTSSGSEYYAVYFPISVIDIRDGTKAANRVPFEFWNLSKNIKLVPKIFDVNENGIWNLNSDGTWETITFVDSPAYVEPLPDKSGICTPEHGIINNFVINGELPETGTVIRINTWKPLREGDIFTITSPKPNFNNLAAAKERINEITVFPNPFYDNTRLYHTDRKVTFTNLPNKVLIRIYTIAGTFVTRLEKDSESPWLDWDLKNSHGGVVGGGIYLAYIEMPGIGNKILKIAVVL
ncbi:MAG: hypothetical protein V1720_04505 [bacterium]